MKAKIYDPDTGYQTIVDIHYWGDTYFVYHDRDGVEWCGINNNWVVERLDKELVKVLMKDIEDMRGSGKTMLEMVEELILNGWVKK